MSTRSMLGVSARYANHCACVFVLTCALMHVCAPHVCAQDELDGLDDFESDEAGESQERSELAPSGPKHDALSEPDTSQDLVAVDSDSEIGTQAQARAATEEEQAPALGLYAAAGLGVGSLGFSRPTDRGFQRLVESAFAAAELLVRVSIAPRAQLSFEAQLAYQTSFAFSVEDRLLFALPERIPARAQRTELSFAPRLAFSATRPERGLALAVPVGVALRSFVPDVHQYPVATHHLGGVFVRPELIVPLGELIELRAGPEALWLLLIEPSLQRDGACCSGYALGFQGAVQARVGSTFSVALAYREQRSVIPAAGRFEDVERFFTVRFGGGL